MSNPSIAADKTHWYQWDTGLTVTVTGGEMNECHFANRKQGTAYVQAVINGVARVPDELLQVAAPIKAYGYVSDGAGGQTYVEQTFDVIARNIPADYTYTKTAQKTIRDAEVARDEAVQAAKDAKASELAADDSAIEASMSAQSAGDSASAASTSASNAAKSAGDAATSASDANAAASKAVDDVSELLKTYTDNAKTSADNAATSASNAADSASAASGSASAAAQSATDASNAKAAAQTAKDEAATSASNAATSASNAESSATAAANSASDAAASVGAINVIAPKTVEVASTAEGYKALSVGDAATAVGQGSVAIGYKASSAGSESIAIGDTANASEPFAVALGELSAASAGGSIAVGYNSKANAVNEFSVGSDELTREITHVSAPTGPNSASNKKYTDDNDTKTLSEAKKYTDANTSNALVGNVSGKLLHVEDAWTSKPLGLTIDGAYKQDGTPSPESPAPIVVVENPVLRVIGKNQFDGEISKFGNSVNAIYLSKGTYTFSLLSNVDWWSNASNNETVYIHNAADNVYLASAKFINPAVGKRSEATFTLNEDAQIKVYSYGAWVNDAVSDLQIEKGTVATDYAPYISATLTITLPAEHPYLAALPNGTHDEIVIDKDGNASLVARVGVDRNVTKIGYVSVGEYYELVNSLPNFSSVYELVTDTVICSAIPPLDKNNIGIYRTFDTVYVKYSTQETKEELQAQIDNVAPLTVVAAIPPKTYHLGKLDIPSLPETISNVWTDAEPTTNMSMTYKRDINIAFENLAQAVVAAAAGE